ncbi:hypothetical protein AB0G73_27795 [Streptomyces sp. NPDC020719]|uniref:hypothetical protein n=1 Tax=Streptomyces sp. NPDC020719 TaxID=3154896 RepID=UPI00340C9856
MDPDAVLVRLREAIGGVEYVAAHPHEDWSSELVDVLQHIAALDEWLSHGGFPSDDWRARAVPAR